MDLHGWLAARNPDQARRMLFMTGGAFTENARSFLARVKNRQVEKPFDIPGLQRLVREALSAFGAGSPESYRLLP